MTVHLLSQAQAFWNRTKAAGWSDEQTRTQARMEAGVLQHGKDFIFLDGSSVIDVSAPLGRKLAVREIAASDPKKLAATAG